MCPLGKNLNISLQYKSLCCIHNLPFPLLHYCGIGSFSSLALEPKTIGRIFQNLLGKQLENLCVCVLSGSPCHACNISPGVLKQHLGDCWLYSSMEMEKTIHEWWWMQKPNFYCNRSFKLIARRIMLKMKIL